jgi:hypothetical protein
MKYRNGLVALAILVLPVTLIVCIQLVTQNASAQRKYKEVKFQQKAIRQSPRIRGVIKGSEKPDEIPDVIAYELFLRTVAEGNARGLVKQSGLNDEEIESIVLDAYSVNEVLQGTDRRAFELKSKKGIRADSLIKSELLRVQQKKDEVIERAITTWRQGGLGPESMKKLGDFVKTQIKKNINKVLTVSPPKKHIGFNKLTAQSFAPQGLSGGGELYLFSPTWHDGFAVYGSGSLSEQYTSDTSYRATVTVTSPTGRSNTTGSDWSYAAIVHDTGLSIGDEDGAYVTEASFEEQEGYYDEYGNFYGTGSSFVGSSVNGSDVPPLITLVSVVFAPPTIPPIQGRISNAIATVSYSNSVPYGTTVDIELNDSITGQGAPLYTLNPPSFEPTNGGVATGDFNRTAKLTVPAASNSPRAVRVTFPFQLSQNTGSGTINANIRLGGLVVPTPSPSPAVTINPPPGGVNATLTVATPSPTPSPTPNPTPSPLTVGGCGGLPFPNGSCSTGFVNSGGYCTRSNQFQSRCAGPTGYDPDSCTCPDGTNNSPILIDVDGTGFPLTDAANGVAFDILALGYSQNISWTTASSTNAFLALDRNLNGRIDNGEELFGNITPQPQSPEPNGFIALAEYDKAEKGGNADGKITRRDAIFRKLRLWIDRNHNGRSEAEELHRLPDFDVVAVRLDYVESDRVDQHGNQFRYRARVRDRANANVGRWAWDVFFTMRP